MSADEKFKKQLSKQIGYIERSAKLYDEGARDEALRIATSLRVIFHQTPKSTSLMTHLGAPAALIRSSVPDRSPMMAALGGRTIVGQFFVSLGTYTASTTGEGAFIPKDNEIDHPRMVPWQEWWPEMFASINGADYTRRGLCLNAANKDGGAHVDDVFPPEYEAIKASGAMGSFEHTGQSIPIDDAHLVFLRSMAFEFLSSPDMRALAAQ